MTVASFTDLRAFAADAPPGAPGGGKRVPMAEGPVTIAAARAAGTGSIRCDDGDLFMVVLAGSVTLAGRPLAAGESVVLPRGTAIDWQGSDDSLVVTMACVGQAGADAPVVIDPQAPLAPSGPPLAELLVGLQRGRSHHA